MHHIFFSTTSFITLNCLCFYCNSFFYHSIFWSLLSTLIELWIFLRILQLFKPIPSFLQSLPPNFGWIVRFDFLFQLESSCKLHIFLTEFEFFLKFIWRYHSIIQLRSCKLAYLQYLWIWANWVGTMLCYFTPNAIVTFYL